MGVGKKTDTDKEGSLQNTTETLWEQMSVERGKEEKGEAGTPKPLRKYQWLCL